MERLTRRSENGTGIYNTPSGDPVKWENNRHEVLQKLAEYEDLEEQGKLLKLPCKLGDITYWISDEDEDGNKIPTVRKSAPVIGIAMQEDGFYILCDGDNEYQKVGGRWCFLTIEDAEAALKEL